MDMAWFAFKLAFKLAFIAGIALYAINFGSNFKWYNWRNEDEATPRRER